MFSGKELAPTEDQGVVFGKVDVPANATMEQVTPFTEKIFRNFKSTPEFSHSFQITFPSGGFGGMILQPWEERKRASPDHSGAVRQADDAHGRAGARVPPAGAPQLGHLPGRVRHRLDGEPRRAVRAADQIVFEASRAASSLSHR